MKDKLRVGDRVEYTGDDRTRKGDTGTVLSRSRETIFVKWDNGTHSLKYFPKHSSAPDNGYRRYWKKIGRSSPFLDFAKEQSQVGQ